MERLTNRNKHGGAYYPYCFKENTCGGFGSSENCNKCDFNISVCEKLAEYEDLEEQGLLIKLPCKTGDTVYIIGSKYRRGYFEDYINPGKFDITDLPKLGNSVFLTKEEAEKALAEMGE